MSNMPNPHNPANASFLTPGEASAICGLTADHLARMANAGKLTATKPGGSHRRYVRPEIEALAEPVSVKRNTITETMNK